MKKFFCTPVIFAMFLGISMTLVLAGCEASSEKNIESASKNETALSTELTEASSNIVEEISPEDSKESSAELQSNEDSEDASSSDEEVDELVTDTGRYTFEKIVDAVMYTTKELKVRNRPSIEGEVIDLIDPNCEVTVTGKCNETGWYRIKSNGAEAYVSSNFLSENKTAFVIEMNPAEQNNQAQAAAQAQAQAQASAQAQAQAAAQPQQQAALQEPTNVQVISNGDGTFQIRMDAIPPGWTNAQIEEWFYNLYINDPSVHQIVEQSKSQFAAQPAQTQEAYLDRATAEAVWAAVNAERAANGLAPLAWDEGIYQFACQRAQALVSDFSHNGHGNYAENIYMSHVPVDANAIHMWWYNSEGHHANYLNGMYTAGACAVYRTSNGAVYAVENFYAGG